MLSLGQKVIAIGALLFIDLVVAVFFLPLGVLGLFFTIPLAILIMKQ